MRMDEIRSSWKQRKYACLLYVYKYVIEYQKICAQ